MTNIVHENVWATVVSIECEKEDISYQPQIDFLHQVDEIFSTYITTSEVSKLRSNLIQI
ncbi:MAG: hypothetical protein RL725_102, partial [Actinomycetota bacterium]